MKLTFQPEYPHNARILKPIERDYAVWRLEEEAGAGEAHENVSTVKAYLSALADPKVSKGNVAPVLTVSSTSSSRVFSCPKPWERSVSLTSPRTVLC